MAFMKKRLRLQGRYILVNIVLIMAIVMLLSAVQFYYFERNSQTILDTSTEKMTASLLNKIEKRGMIVLDYLSEALVNPLYQYDLEATTRVLMPALDNEEIQSVIVFDEDGKIFYDGNKIAADFGNRLKDEAVLRTVLGQHELYSVLRNETLVLARPIFINDTVLGGIYLEMSLFYVNHDIALMAGMISATSRKSLSQNTLALLVTALLLSLVGIFLSIQISRSLIRPIQALVQHAKRIGQGDYESGNQIKRHDEIGELAEAFNDMGYSLKVRNEEISFLAYHDALTRLPNRAMFIKQVEQLIASHSHGNQWFAVLFIDLDDFKWVNDNYGHEIGDNLLCEVASRIHGNLRAGDYVLSPFGENSGNEILARTGGDEFLICLPSQASKYAVAKVSQRLIKAIREPIMIDQEEVVIAASVGIAHYPVDGMTAEELIKNADIAMYQAKGEGKSTFSHFTSAMNDKIKARSETERDLRKGLTDLTQFEIWFQPQFEMNTNALIGAEALIRWHHPDKGLIPPAEFIPIAEETGLIIPIGEWVVESACKQISQWQACLPQNFHIAVNLSAKQIYRQNIVSVFNKLLSQYEVPPQRLHVEVTESLLMQDENEAKRALDSLRGLGIQVWLDDFGTGYSSLGVLAQVPGGRG